MSTALTNIRIGQGFDFHVFCPEGKLILGGVEIPYHQGVKAHSDGDVLLHAACDALIGGAGLGDIGQHFPDSDEMYKGMDSRKLLRAVVTLITNHGFHVVNLDSTIITEKPKLAPFLLTMRQNIAADLAIDINQINVKAKTMEKTGPIGEEKGLAAQVVVLLEKQ